MYGLPDLGRYTPVARPPELHDAGHGGVVGSQRQLEIGNTAPAPPHAEYAHVSVRQVPRVLVEAVFHHHALVKKLLHRAQRGNFEF